MSEPVRAEDSVLVFIDHQVLSMSLMRTLPLETVKANSITLVKAAQILGIPQVWSSSTEDENQDWWLPELAELDPGAYKGRIKRTGIVARFSLRTSRPPSADSASRSSNTVLPAARC
jgi:nicotinamidase-related amidase